MDRLATARKALAEAEQRAGLRVVRTQSHAAPDSRSTSDKPRKDMTGEVSSDDFIVPAYLREAFPGGLPRRGVVSVRGSHFFTMVLASIASEQKAWIAFLGAEDVGWACAESLGVDAGRVVHVPRIATQGSQVVSAAIDGFDVVVVGNVRLDVRERRVLQRRAITKGALLIAMDWPNASLTVDCELRGVSGVNDGIGHIRAVDYTVSTQRGQSHMRYTQDGRGAPPFQQLSVVHGDVQLGAVSARVPS
ncbi:MAG: hypothetical protein GX037_06800 [Trueperella sp.]|nr:hypothetical protein [Trueperella sp.]